MSQPTGRPAADPQQTPAFRAWALRLWIRVPFVLMPAVFSVVTASFGAPGVVTYVLAALGLVTCGWLYRETVTWPGRAEAGAGATGTPRTVRWLRFWAVFGLVFAVGGIVAQATGALVA